MVSISPVPKLLPGPVSYCQLPVLTPVPAAPLKSSLQVSVKPAGGAGTAAGLAVPADAPPVWSRRDRAGGEASRWPRRPAWSRVAPTVGHVRVGTVACLTEVTRDAPSRGLGTAGWCGRYQPTATSRYCGLPCEMNEDWPGEVVVREAVGQVVDRVVVPELGVVVRRRRLVVQRSGSDHCDCGSCATCRLSAAHMPGLAASVPAQPKMSAVVRV